MKSLSIEELRMELTRLEEILAEEGEVVLTHRGRAVARLLPVKARQAPRSHADLQARMKRLPEGSEALIRQDRDGR